MTLEKLEHPARFTAFALISGTIVVLAVKTLLSTLNGSLGLVDASLLTPYTDGGLYSFWTGLAWAIAVFAGGFVSARISRPHTLSEGLLHGLLVWSSSLLVRRFVFAFFSGQLMGGFAGQQPQSLLMFALASEVAALAAGLLGGVVGVKVLQKSIAREEALGAHGNRLEPANV